MKKGGLCLWLLCMVLALSGCGKKGTAAANVTLPPPAAPATVPVNDTHQLAERDVLVYLPAREGNRLAAVPAQARLSVSRHSAESLCQLLFSHPGNEYVLPLNENVVLSGNHPVEVSGNTATVILGASALRLSHEELFTVGQALANTLCQMGDVQYVNVLINGVQPGLDVAATLPAGCFQENTRDDLDTLWNRAAAGKGASRLSVTAALYYPASGARGVLCEARPLSFDDTTSSGMLRTLLDALHDGPVSLQGLPAYPDFSLYLTEEPRLQDDGGTRRAVLHFDASLNTAIIDRGITRSVMVASLVYTITTFLPGVEEVEIHIGDEQLSSLTPSATYTGAGETILFEQGRMKRSDFTAFLLDGCTLYFGDGQGRLQAVTRAVPCHESRNVRYIVNQLIRGSQTGDSREKMQPVLPAQLRDADLIGIAMEEDTLILNFSENLLSLCGEMEEEEERCLVYSLVNTLCRLDGVKQVQFLVNGEQPASLSGHVYLPGRFFPNEDIVTP